MVGPIEDINPYCNAYGTLCTGDTPTWSWSWQSSFSDSSDLSGNELAKIAMAEGWRLSGSSLTDSMDTDSAT